MIEKKVYPNWAYTENQYEKRDINIEIYEGLKKNIKLMNALLKI